MLRFLFEILILFSSFLRSLLPLHLDMFPMIIFKIPLEMGSFALIHSESIHQKTWNFYPFYLVAYGPDHVQLSKVNWRLKVNWKIFWQKFRNIFAIYFTCSESCGLSKVNCNQWKSIGTPISQLELQLLLQKYRNAA